MLNMAIKLYYYYYYYYYENGRPGVVTIARMAVYCDCGAIRLRVLLLLEDQRRDFVTFTEFSSVALHCQAGPTAVRLNSSD